MEDCKKYLEMGFSESHISTAFQRRRESNSNMLDTLLELRDSQQKQDAIESEVA